MITVIIQKLKEQFKGICYFLLGLILYAWMMIGVYPSVSTVKADYLQQMPEQFLKFFGGSAATMMTFNGFMAIEFLSLFFVLIIAFYVGSSSGSAIAGGIEKKTIDFDLSQPISRTRLLLANVIVSLIGTAILTVGTSTAIFLFSKAYHISGVNYHGIWIFAFVATLFMWAILGLGVFLTSILRSKITVAALTVIVTMAFYVFTSLTRMVDKLKDFDKFSLFYLYDPEKIMASGNINWNHIIMLGAIFLIGTISSLIIFNKKDL